MGALQTDGAWGTGTAGPLPLETLWGPRAGLERKGEAQGPRALAPLGQLREEQNQALPHAASQPQPLQSPELQAGSR